MILDQLSVSSFTGLWLAGNEGVEETMEILERVL